MLKLIVLGILLAFLICYLEWGRDQSGFFFQMEYTIFFGSKSHVSSFMHPFILIPLIGQLILIYSLFQKKPSKKLILLGFVALGLLVLFVFLIGVLSRNLKISLSTLPFLSLFVTFLVITRKRKQ